jgi:FMN phosphatase YigB (HAD superfamily)
LLLDVEGAQKAGMHAAWMNRRRLALQETPHTHVRPDVVVHNLEGLWQYLK